jgi:hypothetical protein
MKRKEKRRRWCKTYDKFNPPSIMTAHWMSLNLLCHSLDLSRSPHLKFVVSSATDIVFEIQAWTWLWIWILHLSRWILMNYWLTMPRYFSPQISVS